MVKMQIFFHPDPICDNKLLGCLLQNKFFALNQKGFGGVWRVLGYGLYPKEIFCPTKSNSRHLRLSFRAPLEEIFGEVCQERLMQTENNQLGVCFANGISGCKNSFGYAKLPSVPAINLEQKIYFAGDTLEFVIDGIWMEKYLHFYLFAPNQFEPEVWKNTLKEIQKLNLQKICVTHFGEVSSVSELLSQSRRSCRSVCKYWLKTQE